jgi:[acyl-carrier-protein] S-malonyltransferase
MKVITDYALLFPGQGSQSLNMMDGFVHDQVVLDIFAQVNDILGVDLLSMLKDDNPDRINRTENTQILMLASAYAIYKSWFLKHKNVKLPSYVAGHSLGEYTALVAAEVLEFSDALQLVAVRAKLMQEVADKYDGLMSAIIGLSSEQVIELCSQVTNLQQYGLVNCANFNTLTQIVISGYSNAVLKVNELAKDMGAKAIILPVSVPSHCELMRDIINDFAQQCDKFTFKNAKLPIVNNVTATATTVGDVLKQLLIKQLYMPVEWVHSIKYIANNHINLFIETAPGKVLTGLNRKILPDATSILLMDV